MTINSESKSSECLDVSVLDIIFACSVCSALPPEIYRDTEHGHYMCDGTTRHSDTSSHRGGDEGAVNLLWLASCGHVLCKSDLPLPIEFHPASSLPENICPICVKDHPEDANVDLYWIRGYAKNEHHPDIPSQLFQLPTSRTFDGFGDVGTSVRVQYSNIAQYALKVTRDFHQIRDRWHDESRKTNRINRQLMRAVQRIQELEKADEQARVQIQTYKQNHIVVARRLEIAETQVSQLSEQLETLTLDLRRAPYTRSSFASSTVPPLLLHSPKRIRIDEPVRNNSSLHHRSDMQTGTTPRQHLFARRPAATSVRQRTTSMFKRSVASSRCMQDPSMPSTLPQPQDGLGFRSSPPRFGSRSTTTMAGSRPSVSRHFQQNAFSSPGPMRNPGQSFTTGQQSPVEAFNGQQANGVNTSLHRPAGLMAPPPLPLHPPSQLHDVSRSSEHRHQYFGYRLPSGQLLNGVETNRRI